jgi:hypothetical protein
MYTLRLSFEVNVKTVPPTHRTRHISLKRASAAKKQKTVVKLRVQRQ